MNFIVFYFYGKRAIFERENGHCVRNVNKDIKMDFSYSKCLAQIKANTLSNDDDDDLHRCISNLLKCHASVARRSKRINDKMLALKTK